MTDETLQKPRLLTHKEVEQRTGYRRTWLWEAVKAGAFPQPVRYGRAIRFVESEVDAWVRARIADRDGTTSAPRLLFTEGEIAAACNISVSLLQKDRVTAQRFPFVKVGASVRYDIEEVRAALKAAPLRGKKTAEALAEAAA